jgi:hypothetical protein
MLPRNEDWEAYGKQARLIGRLSPKTIIGARVRIEPTRPP